MKAARLSQDSRALFARLPYDASLCPTCTTVLSNFAGPPCDSLICEREIVEHRMAAYVLCDSFENGLRSASGSLRFVPHAKIARSHVLHD